MNEKNEEKKSTVRENQSRDNPSNWKWGIERLLIPSSSPNVSTKQKTEILKMFKNLF